MRCSLFRALVLLSAIVSLPVTTVDAADSAHLWSENPESSRSTKVESLPDFVELAAKLSPAVVNISSDETDAPSESSEEDEPSPPPEGKTPHNPFEEYSPHAKSLGSGFIVSKD